MGWTHSRAIPVFGEDGEILEWFGAARDISERKLHEETRQLLVSELSHRVKNMLAVIRAIAQQTLRQTKEPHEFAASFGGRILSMSRVHGLLSESGWQGADLHDIVRDQLAAHESLADRSVLEWLERGGPPVKSPLKRGFVTTLIEQTAKGEGGTST
jgi:signal transduction histidine kinase